ncbi:MAG: hypothetical protein K6E76_08225 [Patescibacteria group bacterium]|nr:hypothetical protein [Patescibacteria group bacterium]
MAQNTIYNSAPIKAGQTDVKMSINPLDFQRDQTFNLQEQADHTATFKGSDMNVFILVEGFSFKFLWNGSPQEGKQLLQKVLERSKVIVIAKQLTHYNVYQFHSGFILFPSMYPDPEYKDMSDINVDIR